ncbi:peroxisome biogenesis protein 3-2-like protein [Carex littledalei]|uniref:Peroxisome biogenesis protein 3-2-like protein n=1 Tax=Carex littledalei TaxID=544730 RepID=A0A833W114_9POAL|nr:peroxisome biogenesis protein 3-2-like protein [Carex littledalei]
MFYSRGFWGRHKRKILIGLGAAGGGYVIYRLWDSHQRRMLELNRQKERERQDEELMKIQLKNHFESIQRISDTTTLPYAMHELRARILEQLDLSELRDRLMQGKGQPGVLSPQERIELWGRLKILSFTRTVAALWAVTILSLYVRIQVNVLGRHLYLDIARTAEEQGDSDSLRSHGREEFLATADYLCTHGINTLLVNMQSAVMEVLKEKQLKDTFSIDQLQETITQILDLFVKIEGPTFWVSYLVPEDVSTYRKLMVPSNSSDELTHPIDTSKLEQLMSETRTILLRPDFGRIMDIAMKKAVELLIDEMGAEISGTAPLALAKLLPRVSQMSIPLLAEPENNKLISTLLRVPEIEVFYTLVYADLTLES